MPSFIVDIAVPVSVPKTFHYLAPEELKSSLAVGSRVLVSFGSRRVTGTVVGFPAVSAQEGLKTVIEVLGDPLSPDLIKLARWMADYYLHPLGLSIETMVPGALGTAKVKKKKYLSLLSGDHDVSAARGPKQSELLLLLCDRQVIPWDGLDGFSPATIKALCDRGMAEIVEKVNDAVAGTEDFISDQPPKLMAEQEEAVRRIGASAAAGTFDVFLLHGVTGSGKTEVYLRAVDEVLRMGGGAIYLVPEIALTAQLLSRVQSRFPGREIAVIHSGISRGARYDQWKRIRSGGINLAVGARSALFAPVRNLRLIIVDEEHDPSYKQDDRLRYNARDLALVRGKAAGSLVILGSATPGIQTFFRTKGGAYQHLRLPFRIDDRPLPVVEVVDMKTERDDRGRTPLLSHPLIAALGEALALRKQTLLFLNRRGFHTFLFCPDCGHVFTCPSCDLSLTHHAAMGVLKCHHCDFTSKPPTICPACRGSHVRSQGAGTERVEDEVRKFFPEARIVRMDSDTTSRKGETERILRNLDRREIDILVGTQMITKGHDFPEITLVGVLAADASMNIPDFRAAERTFQLLTQVSGRGGRGDHPGRVVIQTFNPNHYAIRRARQHDYAGFYEEELPLRRELGYPPFSRLIGLHFSSLKKEDGKKAVANIGKRARELAKTIAGGKADVIGPAESPLARLRGRYRWQMLLRGKESRPLHLLAEKLMEGAERNGLEIRVDVDPVHFM